MNKSEKNGVVQELINSTDGFKPFFMIIGYHTEIKNKISNNYIEIASIDNNEVGAFQPMTKKSINSIYNAFDVEINGPDKVKKGWIESSMIYVDNSNRKTYFIFYDKPQIRTIKTTKKVYHNIPTPGMIFIIKDNILQVFAYYSEEIPGPETNLYKCPFSNMLSNNEVCMGNIHNSLANQDFSSEIAYWRKAYWETIFSSLIGSAIKCSEKTLIRATKFEEKWLIKTNKKLKDVIVL